MLIRPLIILFATIGFSQAKATVEKGFERRPPDNRVWTYHPGEDALYFYNHKINCLKSETRLFFQKNKRSYSGGASTGRIIMPDSVYMGATKTSTKKILSFIDSAFNSINPSNYSHHLNKINEMTPPEYIEFVDNLVLIKIKLADGIVRFDNGNRVFMQWVLDKNYYDAEYLLNKNKPVCKKISSVKDAIKSLGGVSRDPALYSLLNSFVSFYDTLEYYHASIKNVCCKQIDPMAQVISELNDYRPQYFFTYAAYNTHLERFDAVTNKLDKILRKHLKELVAGYTDPGASLRFVEGIQSYPPVIGKGPAAP